MSVWVSAKWVNKIAKRSAIQTLLFLPERLRMSDALTAEGSEDDSRAAKPTVPWYFDCDRRAAFGHGTSGAACSPL